MLRIKNIAIEKHVRVFSQGNLKKSKSTHTYMDKAIQKGSVVIQKHSIKIRGKEYCKWIDCLLYTSPSPRD